MGFGIGCVGNCCLAFDWKAMGVFHRGLCQLDDQTQSLNPDTTWRSVVDAAWNRYKDGTFGINNCYPGPCSSGVGWMDDEVSIKCPSADAFAYSVILNENQVVGPPACFDGHDTEDYWPHPDPYKRRAFACNVLRRSGAMFWNGQRIGVGVPRIVRYGAEVSTAYWGLMFPISPGATLYSQWKFHTIRLKIRMQFDITNLWTYADLPSDIVAHGKFVGDIVDGQPLNAWSVEEKQSVSAGGVRVVIGTCGGYFRTWDGIVRGQQVPPLSSTQWMTNHIIAGAYDEINSYSIDPQNVEFEVLIGLDWMDRAFTNDIPEDVSEGVPYGTNIFIAVIPDESPCFSGNPLPTDIPHKATGTGWMTQAWGQRNTMACVTWGQGLRSNAPEVQFVDVAAHRNNPSGTLCGPITPP